MLGRRQYLNDGETMINKCIHTSLVFFATSCILTVTADAADNNGPFLANATRNSWVDQTSVVIWTRTTAQEEFNANGKQFVDLSKADIKRFNAEPDADAIRDAQLPEGATLDEMIGACPGMPGKVRLTYYPAGQPGKSKTTSWQSTEAEHDFTAQWRIDGLTAGTRYTTVVHALPLRSGESDEPSAMIQGAFFTAPSAEQARDVTFCFTTCHDFIRRDNGMIGHRIYPSMTKIAPDFVVHAGDIEYYDKPLPWAMTKELMRFKWGRIFALPNYREFYNTTSTYFMKDDHDTLRNDCWAGQTYGTVSFEEGVQIFNEEQFPSHSPRYKTVNWGKGLQVWFLEGRDYRSPNTMPDGPEKTILGAQQKAWLFNTLEESTATFKVVCSPTPIVGPDRKNKKDNHANDIFVYEGTEIRNKLSALENVIVLCGDRHWQYASVDEDTQLWEFGCGPGSDKHQFGWKAGDQRPTHRFLRVKGGFLSGELTHDPAKKPTLTIKHHKTNGEAVSEFVFPVASTQK
ncbi:MAG: hypothetical protein Aurels2KO_10860 [Aureliella sp.]